MSDDPPVFAEVGEQNIREREELDLADDDYYQNYLDNEYERIP